MQGHNTNADGRPYTLEEALTIYESFHVLEAHEVPWSKLSKEHLFKCNCHVHFKRASCSHCLMAGAACDPHIQIPSGYRSDSVQQRRKHGHRTGKASKVGDDGEAKARDRIALQKDYKLPQVSVCCRSLLVRFVN